VSGATPLQHPTRRSCMLGHLRAFCVCQTETPWPSCTSARGGPPEGSVEMFTAFVLVQ
jgi:hypothetical protein